MMTGSCLLAVSLCWRKREDVLLAQGPLACLLAEHKEVLPQAWRHPDVTAVHDRWPAATYPA